LLHATSHARGAVQYALAATQHSAGGTSAPEPALQAVPGGLGMNAGPADHAFLSSLHAFGLVVQAEDVIGQLTCQALRCITETVKSLLPGRLMQSSCLPLPSSLPTLLETAMASAQATRFEMAEAGEGEVVHCAIVDCLAAAFSHPAAMSCAPGVLVETIQAVLRLAIDGQQARAVRALAVSTVRDMCLQLAAVAAECPEGEEGGGASGSGTSATPTIPQIAALRVLHVLADCVGIPDSPLPPGAAPPPPACSPWAACCTLPSPWR
jgi:hypothetical protein